ncbi:MAG TPA: zinc dependent phospholipase C family protein [Anaerolineales bacterium]|nr:zinc dependent phospholipase C family protein [Anaerolineales bacterium]
MGTWISHLRIAEKLMGHFPELDEVTFAFGNLSPDSGIPNEDWTQFDPPKEVTHFLRKGEGEHAIHDLVYYEQYVANIKPEEDMKRYSFRLGYFFHLICDIMWAKRIGGATRHQFKEMFEEDQKKAVSTVKDDWYGLDQLYVREHPEHIFWRVIIANPNPPSYLPFVKDQALHQQYDHIRKFYSEQEDQWFLSIPYHYLNETTMTRIVGESVEAILIVHEKVQAMKNFDGLQTSVSLIPESLTTPYREPLGNLSS